MNLRRFVWTGLLVLLVGGFAFSGPKSYSGQGASQDNRFRGQTLTLSQWGYNMDLLEKNYIRPFEEKYGVTIVNETGNNADRLTKLVARKDNPIVDVAFFAGNYAYDAMNRASLPRMILQKFPILETLFLLPRTRWAGVMP